MSEETPPKFTEDGSHINLDWELHLRSLDALGEYEEECPGCEEKWSFYVDLRDENGVNNAMAQEGRFFGDVWICEYCLRVYDDVTRAIGE